MTMSADGTRLYGYANTMSVFTLERMDIEADGIVVRDTQHVLSGFGVTIEYADGLVYASCGRIFDPESLTVITNVPGLEAGALVRPDTQTRLVSYLAPGGSNWFLRQCSMDTYAMLREFHLPGVRGTPSSLVQCGREMLAFRTDQDQVFLLRPAAAPADQDGDRLPDVWETSSFGSTSAANGGAGDDWDGDGRLNLAEFLAGTDPTDPADSLRIKRVSREGSFVRLEFYAAPGHLYVIEQSNCQFGSWTVLGDRIQGQGLRVASTHTLTETVSPSFYRVRDVKGDGTDFIDATAANQPVRFNRVVWP